MMKNSFKSAGMLFLVCFLMFGATTALKAQEEETDEKFSFAVSLNSDTFFGFNPFFQGNYAINDGMDFTFYGIFWSAGTGAGWGNWSEFGVGLNFEAGDGLSINPQIGFIGGNLLSSGTAGASIFGDGFVPNLTVNLSKEKVEGQLYAGFYAPLRDNAPVGGTTLSYLHYWANIGYKVSGLTSFGLHFEQLTNTGGSEVSESTDVYQWFGPYIQFAKPGGGPYGRLSAGTDFVDGNDSFFKVQTGFSF